MPNPGILTSPGVPFVSLQVYLVLVMQERRIGVIPGDWESRRWR